MMANYISFKKDDNTEIRVYPIFQEVATYRKDSLGFEKQLDKTWYPVQADFVKRVKQIEKKYEKK